MKTICPPGYHHNGFVATHALEHVMLCLAYDDWAYTVYISLHISSH